MLGAGGDGVEAQVAGEEVVGADVRLLARIEILYAGIFGNAESVDQRRRAKHFCEVYQNAKP